MSGAPVPQVDHGGVLLLWYPISLSKADCDAQSQQIIDYLKTLIPGLEVQAVGYHEDQETRSYAYTCSIPRDEFINGIRNVIKGTQLEDVFTQELLENLASRGSLGLAISGVKEAPNEQAGFTIVISHVERGHYQGKGAFTFSLLELLQQNVIPGPAVSMIILPVNAEITDTQISGQGAQYQHSGLTVYVFWAISLEELTITFQHSFKQILQPPQVHIVAPQDGATVQGLVTVQVDVTVKT